MQDDKPGSLTTINSGASGAHKTGAARTETTENPWRSAEYDPPSRGRLVEIGRSNSRDEIDALDRLYFYPEAGNWNLVGMLWREVTKCNLINR